MVPALIRPAVRPGRPFADALGERVEVFEPGGAGPAEGIRLPDDLAHNPAVELALRERLERLAEFSDNRFTRAVRLETGPAPAAGLVIVSTRPPGVRLSEVLAGLEDSQEQLDFKAVAQIAVELTQAVATFHRAVKDVAIATIAAERVLVTPGGQLLIHEQVLGGLFEALALPRDVLWKQYRVAVPQMAGRLRIDRRADILQIGLVVLSALLGRRITDEEFPQGLLTLSASAYGRLQDQRNPARASAFRSWISRALQLDARRSFGSALDAEEALAEWASGLKAPVPTGSAKSAPAPRPEASALPALLPEQQSDSSALLPPPVAAIAEATGARETGPPPAAPPAGHSRREAPPPLEPPRAAESPGWSDLAKKAVERPAVAEASKALDEVRPQESARQAAGPRVAEATRATILAEPAPMRAPVSRVAGLAGRLARPVPLATLAVVVAVMAGVYWWTRPGPGQARLFVESQPSGAEVSLDGKTKGQTPAEFSVTAGTHSLGISAGGRQRVEPILLVGGERLTRSIELRDLRQIGQLEVRSDPPGGEVTIDGRVVGSAPVIADLRPGSHLVSVRRDGGSVRHEVAVMAGRMRSLLVTLDPKKVGPAPRRPASR